MPYCGAPGERLPTNPNTNTNTLTPIPNPDPDPNTAYTGELLLGQLHALFRCAHSTNLATTVQVSGEWVTYYLLLTTSGPRGAWPAIVT